MPDYCCPEECPAAEFGLAVFSVAADSANDCVLAFEKHNRRNDTGLERSPVVHDDADWNRVVAESSDVSNNHLWLRRSGDRIDALDRKTHERATVSGSGSDSLRYRTGNWLRWVCGCDVYSADVVGSSAGGLCMPELYRGGDDQHPQVRSRPSHPHFLVSVATQVANRSQSRRMTGGVVFLCASEDNLAQHGRYSSRG